MKRKRIVGLVVIAGIVAVSSVGWMIARGNQAAVLGDSTNSPSSRNDQRKTNLASLQAALVSYRAAHNNTLPLTLPTLPTDICAGSSASCKTAKLVDLNFLVNSGSIEALPNDPVGGKGRFTTGYAISRDKTGNIYLTAPRAENDKITLKF